MHYPVNQSQLLLLQVFAHETPFAQVSPFIALGRVLNGERPSRPPNREILGLSDEVWLLTTDCWDRDPTVRPGITDILPFFEAASNHWVPPTSEAIANLGLDDSTAARSPPTSTDRFHCSTHCSSFPPHPQAFYSQGPPDVSIKLYCLLLVVSVVILYFSATIVNRM